MALRKDFVRKQRLRLLFKRAAFPRISAGASCIGCTPLPNALAEDTTGFVIAFASSTTPSPANAPPQSPRFNGGQKPQCFGEG